MASYLCPHMDSAHVIFLPQTRGVDVGGGGLETYMDLFSAGIEVGGVTGR